MTDRFKRLFRLLLLFTIVTSILAGSSCNPEKSEAVSTEKEKSTATENNSGQSVNIIETTVKPDTLAKSSPTMSGHLKRLIQAWERGEIEEYTRSSGIELVGDSVAVEIVCEPSQTEVVAKKVSVYGIIEGSPRKVINITVPIKNLEALEDIPGIRLVRLPVYEVPQDATGEES